MMISLKHRLAFLAVPKTGTTAIEAALQKHADIVFTNSAKVKHMGAARYYAMMEPYLRECGISDVETMAIMRDPIDHLKSWYFFRHRLGDLRAKKHKSTRDMTLEQFIEDYLREDRPAHANVGAPQVGFLCGRHRVAKSGAAKVRPLVDFIFPYERIEDAFDFLSRRLGEPVRVEQKNTSPRRPVDIPQDLLDRLRERLAPDIELHRRVLAGEFYPNFSARAPLRKAGGKAAVKAKARKATDAVS